MIFQPKIASMIVLALILGFCTVSAQAEEARTHHRPVAAQVFNEMRFGTAPAHRVYTPLITNLSQHAAPTNKRVDPATEGREWDPDKWSGGWTSKSALRKLFEGRIFEKQYMRYAQVPVVELGPTFYGLSDLDQRRTLKLLADEMGVFRQGYPSIELQDWATHDVIGAYTPQGMTLR